jgi:hypothetical protein
MLGGLLLAALMCRGSDTALHAQTIVSDCGGQSDGTPCNGDSGVVNLCLLPGATCQNNLCSGSKISCPVPQQCAPTTGKCFTPVGQRRLERQMERRR